MLLWAGRTDESGGAMISKLVIPGQTAVRTALGVCVAMNDDAKLSLRSQLAPGERYFIRVHSHPARAFHSATDDANLVISHDGALSIVVPHFAKYAKDDLSSVVAFEYSTRVGWTELSAEDLARRFVVR